MRALVLIPLILAASACGDSPAAPSTSDPLRLTGQITASTIRSGNAAVATFRLENTSSATVTLDFSSACQLTPFVVRRPGNEIVYPAGGGWVCAQVLTQLTLAPGDVTLAELRVRAGDTEMPFIGLPPGQYALFARLQDLKFRLESTPIVLTVQ